MNSKIPVLEFRGCHGLARMCYTIPYGAPFPKEFSTQSKALVNALGGLDALVALLRRTNKMWVVCVGQGSGHCVCLLVVHD